MTSHALPDNIMKLVNLLDDPRPHMRYHAATKLEGEGLDCPIITESLLRLVLTDPDSTVRNAASSAMQRLAPKKLAAASPPSVHLNKLPSPPEPEVISNPRTITFEDGREPDQKSQRFAMGCLIPMLVLGALFLAKLVFYSSLGAYESGLVGGVIGVICSVLGINMTGWANRQRARARARLACQITDQRPPILILRSFNDDESYKWRGSDGRTIVSLEECIVEALGEIGPVVAVGRPGEVLPPLGAFRVYLGNDWQKHVTTYTEAAQLVVLLLGRMNSGLAWEAELVSRLNTPEKLVLVVPPLAEAEAKLRWEGLQSHMPHPIPPYQGGELLVTFSHSWEATIKRVAVGGWSGTRTEREYLNALDEVLVRLAGPKVRAPAIKSSPKTVANLVRSLEDPRVEIRWNAAKKLGELGPQAALAIAKLRLLTADADSLVRDAAVNSLRSIEGS